MWRVKSFVRGIKNLWRFRKVVWNFRGFDYVYTLNVLEKCLVEQYKYLEKYSGDWPDCSDEKLSIAQALYFIEVIRKNDGDEMQQVYVEKLSKVLSDNLLKWWY